MKPLKAWVLLLLTALAASEPVSAKAESPEKITITAQVDRDFRSVWSAAGITPAAPADDATFLRRVSLDLIGRVPTIAETRSFLADRSVDKRERAVDRLLASPSHARHFATEWRRVWLPQADAPVFARLADDFEDWAEDRLRRNVRYDELVREILNLPVGPDLGVLSPQSFRAAAEYKPENLAANATRAFLGVNLDCAQCHDHPFAKWTRDQFWETAAFFARPESPTPDQPARLEIAVSGTKRVVGPRLLTDGAMKWPSTITAHTGPTIFTKWVTARENPFFARNLVNRLWAQLFGTGLVEPLDDLGGTTSVGQHEVLERLAVRFADGGFDLKALTRALVLTQAYQLSTEQPAGQKIEEPKAFERSAVRGLTGEQLYDSLRVASGLPPEAESSGGERKRFAIRFHAERAATAQRSVVQALTLMNGRATADAVDPATSPIVAAAEAPFFDSRGRVDLFFLAALGRPPMEKESALLIAHLDRAERTAKAQRQALADVLWAILNTAEFTTNH